MTPLPSSTLLVSSPARRTPLAGRSRWRIPSTLAGLLLLVALGSPAAAQPVDNGFKGPHFPEDTGANDEVTAEKPESKLWYNDGKWWGGLWSELGLAYRIYRLDPGTNTWIDTGTAIDSRIETKIDALWDGTKLYVVTHPWALFGTSALGTGGRLYRYSYDGGTMTYSLDPGFPVTVTGATGQWEALVIAKDGVGTLWVTYVEDQQVMVNHSVGGDDAVWGTPYVLPVGASASTATDDIAAIVAFDGRVGIMWSNQTVGGMHFASHVDGANDQTWTSSVIFSASEDDHINIKALAGDPAGKVFAAIKTSDALTNIMLLVCDTAANPHPGCASGLWEAYPVYRSDDYKSTRPMLALDSTNRLVYVFTRNEGVGTPLGIYYKRTSLDLLNPATPDTAFPVGAGTIFISDAASTKMNDPTSTTDPVTDASDLVVLASDRSLQHYYHNVFTLGPLEPIADFVADNTNPTVSFPVNFTDLSTRTPTSWSWDFGDPASGVNNTSALQNPSHTYSAQGTYTVTLEATNAGGSTTETKVDYITVGNTFTTIDSDAPDPSVVGQVVTVTFSVTEVPFGSGPPTGNVTVSDGTINCVASVATGQCDLTFTSIGPRSLTASYEGDGTFTPSTSAVENHQVNATSTTTTITSDDPDPSISGQTVTVTYTVVPVPPGTGTPTGNVTVSDGVDSCIGTVAAGQCTLALSTTGARTLVATYAGDAGFSGSASAGEPHQVNIANSATLIFSDAPDPSVTGQPVTVTYTVLPVAPASGTPTGNVTVSDGVTSCVGTVAAGQCALAFPTIGARTITATYDGDGKFAGSVSSGVSHQVNASGTTTTITSDLPDPSLPNELVTIAFSVVATAPGGGVPTGNVTVSNGVLNCAASVAAGQCTIAFPATGDHTLTATYDGDANYTGSVSAGEPHQVRVATTTSITSALPDPSDAGLPVTVSFSVAPVPPGVGTPTGNVTVSDGVDSCVATVAVGSCDIVFNTSGARTLTATYPGDATFSGSVSPGEPHQVDTMGTVTTITSDVPDPSTINEATTITFTVTPVVGGGTPTGTVTVSDGIESCNATVAAGSCVITWTTPGPRTLTASYPGDATFAPSTSVGQPHQVTLVPTTTTITSDLPDPTVSGQAATVSFTVVENSAAVPGPPTGNVTVSDGTASCVASVAIGSCSLTMHGAGPRTLTATYAGDASFASSTSAGQPHQVNAAGSVTSILSDAPDPSVTGQAFTVSYSVTAAAPGSGTPTGTVTVSDGFNTCSASVAAGSCLLTINTVGAKNLTATYAGDAAFAGSTSTAVAHQVSAAATTVAITSDSPDPSETGSPVSVAFVVSPVAPGSGTPSGLVTVSDGVTSCIATVAVGACSLTFPSAGSRVITASYAGEINFAPSASPGEVHQVNDPVLTTIGLDRTDVRFGAVNSAGSLVALTAPQQITISKSGPGSVNWTVTSNRPWLQVSPAAGSGSGVFTIQIQNDGSLPLSGNLSGAVTVTSSDALGEGQSGDASPPQEVAVTVTTFAPGTTAAPFGVIDTPLDGVTGVSGSLGVTGWALDDLEVTRVRIFRDPVPPEPAGTLIFVGDAVLLNGARPDVAAANPTLPLNTRGGWGFLILTNMLPNQGNGSYVLHVFAEDKDGNTTLLGTRTITADNANATAPFGAIDTPEQGATVGGTDFVNFGWALTPQPKAIPLDGSTITVFVDGAPIGTVDYNHFRSDIATLFPGLANTNGAVGFRTIDTTVYANGVHTIAWGVTDSAGAGTGVGSRFFNILNGGATATLETTGLMAPTGLHAPADLASAFDGAVAASRSLAAPIGVRRGVDTSGPPTTVWPTNEGVYHVRGEELGRVEILLDGTLGDGASGVTWHGWLDTGDGFDRLPIGSALDRQTGRFTWQAGPGYVGAYDLVFRRSHGDQASETLAVRLVLAPLYADQFSPRMWIDMPANDSHVQQPFAVAGWAADLAAIGDAGVDTLHVWAFPVAPGDGQEAIGEGRSDPSPIFLGAATHGGPRPDVGLLFGSQFTNSGFGLAVRGLEPGEYDLVVYAHSSVTGTFNNAQSVRITVR